LGAAFAIGNDGRVSVDPSEPRVPFETLALTEVPPGRRATVLAATGLLASFLIAGLTIIPSPYAIGTAGPTFDTLGEVDGVPLVSITGAPTYETTGELRLTTVSEAQASSTPFTVGQVISGFFSPEATVLPEEAVFGDPNEREENQDNSAQDWVTSQEKATVSALEALGQEVPATLTIVEVSPESNAAGLLQADDVIVAADGGEVESWSDFASAIDAHEPGEEITVTVMRGGEEVEASFELLGTPDGDPLIGILVDPAFDLPIEVDVKIDSVGGPSAGSMFALAIMDLLTEQDELRGAKVAGTGTIDIDGDIGPIGGIHLKMIGARDDGAEYFLAPVENCGDVIGHVPEGLSVYAVDNLDEAYAAVIAIGRDDTAGLPTCPAAKDET
jgi:PDZ domain-containing protein